MIFGFAISYAEDSIKRHEKVPEEVPKSIEDLLEVTDLTWEEMGEGISYSILKKERFLEDLQDEEILKNIDVNLRTKEEIADYMNSLSARKLKELHFLRDAIKDSFNKAVFTSGLSVTAVATLGALVAADTADFDSNSKFKKTLFKRVSNTSYGIAIIAFLVSSYTLLKSVVSDYYGLGIEEWDGSEKSQVIDYINSLTLEEAREVLVDIKKINEEKETK